MPKHGETRFLPFSAAQMFDLVADIERYPQFLPWVQALRVKTRGKSDAGNEVVTADMVVGFKMVRERFTSKVVLVRPERIEVEYLSGPLKYLKNDWTFRDVKGGCEIDFLVDFEFQNRMFERLAGMFFGEALRRMVGAFETRAAVLYGTGASGMSKDSATSAA